MQSTQKLCIGPPFCGALGPCHLANAMQVVGHLTPSTTYVPGDLVWPFSWKAQGRFKLLVPGPTARHYTPQSHKSTL